MTLTNRLGRPMLAAMFVSGGADQLRNPEGKAAKAGPVVEELSGRVDAVPDDAVDAVRINGAVQLVAGGLLAINRVPRLAATALAASLVPTTLAGHRFWEVEDEQERAQQRIHFFKNLAMLGGLVITIGDTGRNPSLGWRASRAARRATDGVTATAGDVRRTADDLRRSTSSTVADVADSLGGAAAAATAALPTASAAGPDLSSAADDARDLARNVRDASAPARKVARKRAKELASTVRSVDVASHRDDLVEQARDLAARAADLGRDLGRTAADRLSDVDIPKVSKARRFPKLNLAR